MLRKRVKKVCHRGGEFLPNSRHHHSTLESSQCHVGSLPCGPLRLLIELAHPLNRSLPVGEHGRQHPRGGILKLGSIQLNVVQ